jgi:hypothetical protein
MIDSSNHRYFKIASILVHNIAPQQAVKMKVLDFTNLSEESSAH